MNTMKIHALLLLGIIAAAGATTITDAHAQTNSERIIQIASDTGAILDMLGSIQAAVEAALGSMADQMSSVASTISGMDQKVDDVSSEVGHVAGDVEDLGEAVADIDSKISEMMAANEDGGAALAEQFAQFGAAVPRIQTAVDSIASDTAALAAVPDAVERNAEAISALTETVNEMNAKLDAISDSLNVVQEVVETPTAAPPQSGAAALSPANLIVKSSKFEFTVGTFGDSVLKAPSANTGLGVTPTADDDFADRKASTVQYTASVSFECSGDVYVTSVETTGEAALGYNLNNLETVLGNFIDSQNDTRYDGSAPPAYAYGEIESVVVASPPRDVYYRNFNLQHGPNLYVDDAILDREIDMNYYALDEGSSLKVTAVYREFARTLTTDDDDAHDVKAQPYYDFDDANDADEVPYLPRPVSSYVADSFAERAASGAPQLATLNVGWTTSDPNTTCGFTVTSDAPREMVSDTKFYSLVGTERGIAYDFNRAISCHGQKTTITDMVVSIPTLELYSYATFEVSSNKIGANDDQKTKLTEWTFNSTGSFMSNADILPYDLMKGDELIFEGSVPGVEKLLISVAYDTVKGNTCQ